MQSPFMNLEPPVRGQCDVCEQHTDLTILDRLTALRVGVCCYGELKYAHDKLDLCWRVGGPRHPQPGEIATSENH
jgi:hypothetical protein